MRWSSLRLSASTGELTDKLTFLPSDDGKTMTMNSHITSATMPVDRKFVYNKRWASAAMAAPSNNTPGAGMAASASGSHPSLAGVETDPSKSNFGQVPPPASQVDTIEDNEPSVQIVEDQKGGIMGDMNITSKLTPTANPRHRLAWAARR